MATKATVEVVARDGTVTAVTVLGSNRNDAIEKLLAATTPAAVVVVPLTFKTEKVA